MSFRCRGSYRESSVVSFYGSLAFFVHTVADIFYLILAILFATLMFQAAFGLLPRSRPRVWPFRVTGLRNVRLSRFSVISIVVGCFGVAVAFSSAAFSEQALGFIGLVISVVGFIFASVSRSRDVRHFRQQRLAGLTR